MDKKRWYRLDNAGKLYPSIASTRRSTVFRLSAKLSEKIEPKSLQKALEITIKRMPYFKVHLHRGVFWYYFEETDYIPRIEPETYYPCMFLNFHKEKTFPFRILYHQSYIHLEVSHSITDGTGALIFLKTLLVSYYKIKENICPQKLEGALQVEEEVIESEGEDGFTKYYKKGIPVPKNIAVAKNFPFELMEKGKYYFITGISPLADIKKIANTYNCTVTQLITSIYFMAIQDLNEVMMRKGDNRLNGNIVMNLPVDLRKMFPSNTMRNFFVSVTPAVDFRLGHYELEEIIRYTKGYMSQNINPKDISRYISRNVRNERNPIIRLIPLSIKNLVMPYIYNHFGERLFTSSVSNLGLVKLPEEITDKVESIEFYPAPSERNKIKMCISTYNDKVYISFGSITKNTEVEKYFFRRLRKMGISIKIETNRK